MVKLIVLDVDGVIVGHKVGVNFPYPSPKVISALKEVGQKGIPVVLCSGKYYHAIEPIILQADLKNPHIVSSGSMIVDPLGNKTVRTFFLEKGIVSNIITTFLENNIYIEAFDQDDYFVQKNQVNDFTPRRTLILQKDPVISDSLLEAVLDKEIIRLAPIVMNEQEKEKADNLLKLFLDKINFVWTLSPSTGPIEYGLATSKTASKSLAIKEVAKELGIPMENALGVGDTLGDWEFMKLCGYAATMADASEKLKELVESKEKNKYLVAPSVDNDGILQILESFLK